MVAASTVIAGVQAAGSLASAFGLGRDKGPGFTEQKNHSAQLIESNNRAHIKSLVGGALANGIHPLAALGISPSGTTVPQYDTSSINGQNIGRAVGSAIAGFKQNKLQELAVERAELENDLLRSQISNVNNQPGDAPNPLGAPSTGSFKTYADENTSRYSKDPGLTAGSEDPPPGGKKFTVGETPYGKVYINLPPSGQADEYGELYGAAKGLEYMAKRGYVHYANGTYRAGKSLRRTIQQKFENWKKSTKSKAKPYKYKSTKNNPMFN
jgi:hypothetical protein